MKKWFILGVVLMLVFSTGIVSANGGADDAAMAEVLEPDAKGSLQQRIPAGASLEFSVQGPESIEQYLSLEGALEYMKSDHPDKMALRLADSADLGDLVEDKVSLVAQDLMSPELAADYSAANKNLNSQNTLRLTDAQGRSAEKTVLFNLDIYGFSGSDPGQNIKSRIGYNLRNPYYRNLVSSGDVVRFTFNAADYKGSFDQEVTSVTFNGRKILGIYYLEPAPLEDVLPPAVVRAVRAGNVGLRGGPQGIWLPLEVLHDAGDIFIDQSDPNGTVVVYIYRWPKDDRIHVG